MRVIVTRLLPQAVRWVQLLQPHGHDGLALPLIEVAALTDASALLAVRQQVARYAAVMFVSSPAVDGFFSAGSGPVSDPGHELALPARAWCTGPGTRAALVRHGMAPGAVDAPDPGAGQLDSEALWQRVGDQIKPGVRILIVRGDTLGAESTTRASTDSASASVGVGRDWLAQRLQQAGAQVDFVVAYRRCLPQWSAVQRAQALAAAGDGSVWLFSSAEAVNNLKALLPAQDWSHARAIATHARIATAAQRLGFSAVLTSRPSLPAVLASLESIHD